MIREFVAPFLLCELCGAFAFFAFTILVGTAKAAKRTPKRSKGLHLEFQISDLRFAIDQVPIAV